MMLEFIFKYTWVAMLVIIYVIWSVKAIKDIVHTKHVFKNKFDIEDLDDTTQYWLIMTLLGMFGASLLYCILGGAE